MTQTIAITEHPALPCVRMTWQEQAADSEIKRAFARVCEILDLSPGPIYVMVVFGQEVHVPVNLTVLRAVPIQRHMNMRGWLFVRYNATARIVDSVLTRTTHKYNTRWFDTEKEALNYLRAMYSPGCEG